MNETRPARLPARAVLPLAIALSVLAAAPARAGTITDFLDRIGGCRKPMSDSFSYEVSPYTPKPYGKALGDWADEDLAEFRAYFVACQARRPDWGSLGDGNRAREIWVIDTALAELRTKVERARAVAERQRSDVAYEAEQRAHDEARQRAEAQKAATASAAKADGVLAQIAQADGRTAAAELAEALKAADELLRRGAPLQPADAARVAPARRQLADRQEAARLAEAEAWERDRPAREARARQAEEEVQAQRQRDAERRAAERQAEERADAALLADARREDAGRLARDPCNRVEVRREMMAAANAVDRSRYGGSRLLDLTSGRTTPAVPPAARACLFVADWSSGGRGLVLITLRKNSFGDDLIEVRPY